jgi:hypothetical protein
LMGKKWKDMTPEQKTLSRARCARYEAKDREYWARWRDEWRKRNPNKDKEYRDKYKATPERRLRNLLNANTVDRSALRYEDVWWRLVAGDFRCEITNIPFEWEPRSPRGLSIDRIDRSKPYTLSNIRLVCWWVNAAMGTWGLAELKRLITEWHGK